MSAYGGHPGRKTIAAYLARTCGAADQLWLDEHLRSCTECYRVMVDVRLPETGRVDYAVETVPVPVRVRRPQDRAIKAEREHTDSPRRAASQDTPGGKHPAPAAPVGHTAPKIVTDLISGAINLLPETQRERYKEEWKADLLEINGKWRKIRWALGIRFYSARVIRRLYRRESQ
jgi:putative zinc finger protein